jgi:hypothetical protein
MIPEPATFRRTAAKVLLVQLISILGLLLMQWHYSA